MHVRIIDYICNIGGGQRFVSEVVAGLAARFPDHSFEIVGNGQSVETYRRVLGRQKANLGFAIIPPSKTTFTPWDWALKRLWRFDIPAEALGNCDVAWVPWSQRHRVAKPASGSRLVVTIHDVNFVEQRALFVRAGGVAVLPAIADELQSTRIWMRIADEVVTSSNTAAAAIRRYAPRDRPMHIVPLSGAHLIENSTEFDQTTMDTMTSRFPWATGPYLLFPANTSPHKNHERFLDGYARSGIRWPLILTGENTDLANRSAAGRTRARAKMLRKRIAANGVSLGVEVFGLGYVSRAELSFLMERARAIVMPTLAEGGGSFPAMEAIQRGVPVLCSDIPVLREQISYFGGTVEFFDPYSSEKIADAIRRFSQSWHQARIASQNEMSRLRVRSWQDVADDYWRILSNDNALTQRGD